MNNNVLRKKISKNSDEIDSPNGGHEICLSIRKIPEVVCLEFSRFLWKFENSISCAIFRPSLISKLIISSYFSSFSKFTVFRFSQRNYRVRKWSLTWVKSQAIDFFFLFENYRNVCKFRIFFMKSFRMSSKNFSRIFLNISKVPECVPCAFESTRELSSIFANFRDVRRQPVQLSTWVCPSKARVHLRRAQGLLLRDAHRQQKVGKFGMRVHLPQGERETTKEKERKKGKIVSGTKAALTAKNLRMKDLLYFTHPLFFLPIVFFCLLLLLKQHWCELQKVSI